MSGGSFWGRWRYAPVTLTLVALNVVLFFLDMAGNGGLSGKGVLIAQRVLWNREFNRLLTAVFLHADLMHLFSNMILLYYVGAVVERNLGQIRFSVLYLTAGIFGNIATVAWDLVTGRAQVTSLGASGAVYGVLGALLIMVWRERARLRGYSSLLRRLVMMLGISLATGLASSNINNVAHIAGFAAGAMLGYGLMWNRGVSLDGLA